MWRFQTDKSPSARKGTPESLFQALSTARSAAPKACAAASRFFTSPSAAYFSWCLTPKNGGSALELIEIAPGIDLQQDVLAHMDFAPRVANPLKMMDARLFQDEPMQLQSWLLDQQAGQTTATDRNRFFCLWFFQAGSATRPLNNQPHCSWTNSPFVRWLLQDGLAARPQRRLRALPIMREVMSTISIMR